MVQPVTQLLKVAVIGIMSLLVAFGGVNLFDHFQEQNIPDNVGQTYTITIDDGASTDEVAAELHDAGVIRSEFYFKSRIRVNNAALEPGTYTLTIGMSVPQILDVVTGNAPADSGGNNGGGGDSQDLTITIIEGWRTEQIADELDALGYEPGDQAFLDATKTIPNDAYSWLADRSDTSSLEGYLFPDTYNFASDTPPEDMVYMMLDNFDSKFDQDLRDQATNIGMSVQDMLIYASLVEREAAVGEERPIIADIYIKRFNNGWNLEADPTVQFAVGHEGDWWPELSNDDLFVDSPYNTYQNAGLPPTPIANPGYASIKSVLYSQPTDYWFFFARADGSGTHLFAATLEDQQQNIDYVQGDASEPAPNSDPFVG